MDAPNRPPGLRLRRRGFTLIEIMTAIAIVSILAALALPNYQRYQLRSKTAEVFTIFGGIKASQQAFFSEHDEYANITGNMPQGAPDRTAVAWPPTVCPDTCDATSPEDCTEFECIGFRAAGSTYFIYRSPHALSTQADPAEFCIGARGDLDGDGDELNYEFQSDNAEDGDGNDAACPWSERNGCEPGTLFPNVPVRCDPEDW